MMLRMLQKKIKGLKYDKYGIEKDAASDFNNGVAYISTTLVRSSIMSTSCPWPDLLSFFLDMN